MNEMTPWLLMAALTVSWMIDVNKRRPATDAAPAETAAVATAPQAARPDDPGKLFHLDDLLAQREKSGRPYLPFLNEPTLRTGLYVLPAGAQDRQQPHDLDEVYYVIAGRAVMTVGDEQYAVRPGSVVFVAAHADHRFHDIVEDLHLLVFFSEAAPDADDG